MRTCNCGDHQLHFERDEIFEGLFSHTADWCGQRKPQEYGNSASRNLHRKTADRSYDTHKELDTDLE